MAVAVWIFGKVHILALSDQAAPEGGCLARPSSFCGLHGLDGIRSALETILLRGCRAILLDLSRVTGLDSSDLGELAYCYKLAAGQGIEFALLRPTGQARAVLHVVRLDLVFKMFDDEATAVAALGG